MYMGMHIVKVPRLIGVGSQILKHLAIFFDFTTNNNSAVKEGFFLAVDKNTSFFLRLLFHAQMIKSVRLVNVS